MTDHTKKTTFAGFVNVDKSNKYWMEGHFEYGEDAPTLFRFNTKEEKAIVQEVAQSYLDNWGCDALELVIFEAKARHVVTLKKRTESEMATARAKSKADAEAKRESVVADVIVDGTETPTDATPKKRGRKPKTGATI